MTSCRREAPETRTEFTGFPAYESASGSDRGNLPERVETDVTYRDVRVDRIWEGTSEIQRLVIGGQIKKRGLGIYTGWGA